MSSPAQSQADIDPRLLQAPEAATQRATFNPCSTFSPIPHCFACPVSCQGSTNHFDGRSPRPSAPSNGRKPDLFVACDMAEHSPFAQLKASTTSPMGLPKALPPGRCSSPDTVFPFSHVQKAMLPRVQAIIASHQSDTSTACDDLPPSPTNSSSDGSSTVLSPRVPATYDANQQLDELMHVIQLHTSNVFSMKENAGPLADELRALLRISSSGATALGTAPDATLRPKQYVCACLIRANLMFLLADHLFRAYAALDPETGFGLPNVPTSGTADAALVREAEALLHDSLRLHDVASDALSREAARGLVRPAGSPPGGSPPAGSPISEAAEELRSVRHVQPRSKVMLRFALVQAALYAPSLPPLPPAICGA